MLDRSLNRLARGFTRGLIAAHRAEHLRRGDLILGCWHAGHFEAAAIVPREAVAVPPTDTDESDDLDPA